MSPRVFVLLAVVLVEMSARVRAGDRPKLPRGSSCRICQARRLENAVDKLAYMTTRYEGDVPEVPPLFFDVGRGAGPAAAVAAAPDQLEQSDAARDAARDADLVQRVQQMQRMQRRSPYWPLRHPALDTRKRHRESPTFLHPVVRFVQPYNELGGPFFGAEDGWEVPAKPLPDNFIRERPAEKTQLLTAEDLIRALQERQWKERPTEEDSVKASVVRFGGIGRK